MYVPNPEYDRLAWKRAESSTCILARMLTLSPTHTALNAAFCHAAHPAKRRRVRRACFDAVVSVFVKKYKCTKTEP